MGKTLERTDFDQYLPSALSEKDDSWGRHLLQVAAV